MTLRPLSEHPTDGLTVVTTHLNADFDALASALVATKLYPGAKIVLPGSQEKGLRDFLLQSTSYLIDVTRLKDIDLEKVRILVVVDTSQRSRLGALADLVDRPGVEVHLYDHHVTQEGDLKGKVEVVREVGANTTLMVQLLRERGCEITPDEAGFLALGIYEDTGSFTFPSTTPEDLEAAAWLLTKGADLNLVGEIIGHRFTPEHVELLSDMLQTAVTYTFAGIPITVAKTSTHEYVEDFAVLAHELMDMQRLPVLFALVMMADQVLIVGRSREDKVDVGAVLEALGGGGHPMAASVTLKGVTLAEAEERLIAELHRQLGTEPKVKDIMSYPVLSVSPDTPLAKAQEQLTRYGITVLPVMENGEILGIISRRTVQKALYHGLHAQPVSEYMTIEFQTVGPDEPLSKVQDIIVRGRQRFVPVVEKGKLVGVITRTDLLEILTGEPSREPEPLLSAKEQRKNVVSLLREKLPKEINELLRSAGETAEVLGLQLYVVGGFVRDLLLRRPNFDIDFVVEGDGIVFAKAFGKKTGAKVRTHEKFKTAVLIFPDGRKIDVATARWEYYEYPAAMPTVALSSIKLDLFRRDFTINTLAIKLNPREFGTLIDFFGGQRDLKDRVIRVLHSLSFVEDPTRVFRAVRFEQRYGFRIGKHTLRLIKNALKLHIFDKLSGKRLLGELRLILKEPDPRPAINRLSELDVLKVIHPSLKLTPDLKEALAQTYDVLAWYDLLFRAERARRWIVYLLALFSALKLPEVTEAVERLGFTGSMKRLLVDRLGYARQALHKLSGPGDLRPSEIYHLLKDLDLELLLHLIAVSRAEKARQAVSRFITDLRDIRPALRGKDLKVMGIEPGPIYRVILDRLLMARLDGEVHTRQDEEELVKRRWKTWEREWQTTHSKDRAKPLINLAPKPS